MRVNFTEKETRYADRKYDTIVGVDPPDGYAVAKVEPGHYMLAPDYVQQSRNNRFNPGIETGLAARASAIGFLMPQSVLNSYYDIEEVHHGFGNDDQLMEQMLDKEAEEGMSRKDVLTGHLDRLLTELDKLEALGEDVYEDDAVLFIKYKHTEQQEMEYSYIALKSAGRWYVTGYQNEGPRSWSKMVEFFSHGIVTEMWMAEGWERII